MNYRLKIIFSGQPAIDDSITINAQFIEIFKASRTNLGEVAIGATLGDTIINLQNALIEDYQGLFPFTTSIEGNILILNFIDYNETFFNLSTSSNVITFELVTGYFPYFISNYDNKVDNFNLVILGNDPTFIEENISATASLSYKDVDNILEPLRGAQLNIDIDANIAKPYNLFLDFRELDFKAKLYRNGDLLFEGFINPEGVVQNYNSINWRAQLVAVDNLGSLKNKEFEYNNHWNSEFVFMDLCLKRTGLYLPIAFFDDINQNVIINNTSQIYGGKLEDAINERLIRPKIYENENGTYQDCETILIDILNKYNAILVQQNISYLNRDTGQEETMLCWLFARVSIMNRPITNFTSKFKIKKITDYSLVGDILFPVVENYNYTFGIPLRRIGTDGEGTQFEPLDAIHKNKNQLIRQERALRAFRFIQEWVKSLNIFEKFDFGLFEYIGSVALENYFFPFNPSNLNQPLWKARGSISTFNTFDPNIPIENQSNNAFSKLITINLADDVTQVAFEGSGSFIIQGTSNIQINAGIQFQVLHTDLNGNKYYLQQPPSNNGSYDLRQIFFQSVNNFSEAFWIRADEIQSDESNDLTMLNISHPFFAIVTQQSSVSADELSYELPELLFSGGTIDIYFSPLYARDYQKSLVGAADPTFADIPQSSADLINFILKDFKFTVSGSPELGKGEYHDAINDQDVSSKVGEPVKIINAEDKSNIFLNQLKRLDVATEVNYDYWTSFWNPLPNKINILELMSIERIRLFSKSQNIFSGDIDGYVPYFSRLLNTAYPANINTGDVIFVFTKWVYDTVNNTIEADMRECKTLEPSVNYERNVIFEDEPKKLIP